MHIHDKAAIVRKPHRCRVCDGIIAKGEACHLYRGIEPGEGPYTCHFHPDCWANTRHWTLDDWESAGPGDISREEIALEAESVRAEKGAP